MKAILLSLGYLLTACSTLQAQDVKSKSSKEPKVNLEVTINGKKTEVTEDEEFTIDSVLVKPTISVRLSALRKFDISSISFDYPKHLSFEFEQDYGYKNWTLSGNSFVVMVFELDAKTPIGSLIDEMIKKFGKKNCNVEDFEKELGRKLCNGKRLTVNLAGQRLILDCYEIVLNDFKSRFIYFQDTFTDNQHSAEYQQWFNTINDSIKFK